MTQPVRKWWLALSIAAAQRANPAFNPPKMWVVGSNFTTSTL